MGLFRKTRVTPYTGDPDDDKLLSILARSAGGLGMPRHWVHYIYCIDEQGVQSLTDACSAEGWRVRRADEPDYGVVAERSDRAVSPSAVLEARLFFDAIANSVPGGYYDGWEAEV